MPQRKRIFTLDLGGTYSPTIKALTFPLIKHYADRIGASFEVITEDKFPGWPDRTNKFQIHDLIAGEEDTWAIFYDADTLIHPDMPDITELISKDTVLHNAKDFAALRWKYDPYFWRDGRHLGSCSWYEVAHSWCRDFWCPPSMQQHPIENRFMTLEEIVGQIRPIQNEIINRLDPAHLIDDFTFSRNIARFGLKFQTLQMLGPRVQCPFGYHWHLYLLTEPQKVERMKDILHLWQVDGSGACMKPGCPRCNPQGQPVPVL